MCGLLEPYASYDFCLFWFVFSMVSDKVFPKVESY